MSKAQYQMEDYRLIAAEAGIDLPPDDVTNAHLRIVQLQEEIRQRKTREAREERRWFWGKVFGILTILAGGGAVTYSQVKPDAPPPGATEQGQKEAVTEAKASREATRDNSRKIEKLGVIAVEQQEQLVQSVEYISDKIDAAHPRQKKELQAIDEPPALKQAKDSVEERKKKAAAGRLLEIDTGP